MTNVEEEYLGDFGGYGEGDGKFVSPTAIAQDSQQNLYVSDEWLQRISIFDKGASSWTNGAWPEPETESSTDPRDWPWISRTTSTD